MSMTELISSYSSLNLLTFLFRQKPEKSETKNYLVPRSRNFAIHVEFLALMEFVLSRIHIASELFGMTFPFINFDVGYLSDKEKCAIISNVSRASTWHKTLGEKNFVLSLPKNNASTLASVETEQIPLFNQTDLIPRRNKWGQAKNLADFLGQKPGIVESKCNCPLTFGCIIPQDFFSNPFNRNFSSNLEGGKFSNQTNEPDVGKCKAQTSDNEYEDDDIPCNFFGQSKLEMYSSQLISIVEDVCKIVKKMENGDEYDEAIEVDKHNLEEEDSPFVKEELNAEEEEHPLLDEGIYMTENTLDDTEEIEKLLGYAFSSKSRKIPAAILQDKEVPRFVCNPPCSIWCDADQESEKNAFKAGEQQNAGRNGFGIPVKSFSADLYRPVIGKPLYKRSLSANDCLEPKNLSLSSSSQFRGFDPVSREKLIFLRKDPVAYFKIFGHNNRPSWRDLDRRNSSPLPNTRDYKDILLDQYQSNRQLKKSSANRLDLTKRSGMWGPFDGEDSLWQPLPECVPSVEQTPKQNAHKRVRDLRRQRSLN